ncbi:hypothetical protein DFH11DRAFT_1591663 [Phellopilus nigrolimitatus]|nr:hypothetical protein DFH11DRAFT_1591663 [Phellopilus nigrolimitatus]
MSSPCQNNTLPGRPDIEGIGTRVATYAQLLMAIFTIALSPGGSSFDSWWTLLVTSLGLQLAAIAQRENLTLFHVIVVSWLAFPIFAMSWVYIFWHWREEYMPSEILLATHLHGFVFVGFGLWIWSTAPSFGACPELNSSMQLVVLGKSVPPLGGMRFFIIALFSIWGFMFVIASFAAILNAILPARRGAIIRLDKLYALFAPQITSISTYIPSRTRALILVTVFNVVMLALSIWSIEALLIRNVTGVSRAEDSSWTFGQISALILLVGPVFTLARLIRFLIWGRRSIFNDGRENASPRTGAPAEIPDLPDEKNVRPSSLSSRPRNLLRKSGSNA